MVIKTCEYNTIPQTSVRHYYENNHYCNHGFVHYPKARPPSIPSCNNKDQPQYTPHNTCPIHSLEAQSGPTKEGKIDG